MRSAATRWAILAAIPLLVGAVLLMHGLDAGAHLAPSSTVATADHHGDHPDHGADRDCDGCPSAHHLFAACVAVGVTMATVARARALRRSARPASRRALSSTFQGVVTAVARPPDPAWVRLAVMRC